MHWEALSTQPPVWIRRAGRFLVVDLQAPHRVLSTSVRNGGQTEHLCHLVNHQSCEGSGHEARSKAIHDRDQDGYHDAVCAEVGAQTLPASVLPGAIVQQAATLAASLAAKPHQWAEFRTRLHANGQFEPKSLVLAAIALGWSEKWRAS